MRFVLIIAVALLSYGADVHLAWDANTEPDLAGYKIHYGFEQGNYTEIINVGNVTEYLVRNLPSEREIFFVATAYTNENESEYSNEVITVAYYFLTIKIEYDTSTGQIKYRGEHKDYNADVNDINWTITKYYYDSTGFLIEIRRRITSWVNRASGW